MDNTNYTQNQPQCETIKGDSCGVTHERRRTANYKPNIWSYDFIQSLTSNFTKATYKERAEKLKDEFVDVLSEVPELSKPHIVETIRKLGLSNVFHTEIMDALDSIVSNLNANNVDFEEDILDTSLSFRLLRQHGYHASEDMFINFIGEMDLRKGEAGSKSDFRGILELFEATRLALDGEEVMEKVKTFSYQYLTDNFLDMDINLAKQVAYASENPCHRKVLWFDVRHQIHTYELEDNKNLILLELAKLNFNIVQDMHLEDLKQMSRWDYEEVDQLPECMKICFQALVTTTNEIAKDIQKDKCWNNNDVSPFLKTGWADFCKALLLEAWWDKKRCIPSLEDYLSSAWITSSGPLLSLVALLCTTDGKPEELYEKWEDNQDLIYYTSLVIRLLNDQGTSAAELERGDAHSSILCYMEEASVTEAIAREHMKDIIDSAWSKINMELLNAKTEQQTFVNLVINTARVCHFIYQKGDGFSVQDGDTKKKIKRLLIEPIKL
ncbi:(E,E)-alpha-farnesene synthase isoform X3 [Spinacia oleracea]|uniref:(E,E)-alpha-farnesene synthase isoform X3 n=1 Tax=Spinacia oleracea TaxID=3562 RepID=A0ABM3R295_SPIOL|nr:(E,E)-alpha-farnesene synthase-like isoform X3 [Spinacia oleracea]